LRSHFVEQKVHLHFFKSGQMKDKVLWYGSILLISVSISALLEGISAQIVFEDEIPSQQKSEEDLETGGDSFDVRFCSLQTHLAREIIHINEPDLQLFSWSCRNVNHFKIDFFLQYYEEIANGHVIKDVDKFKRQQGCLCLSHLKDPHCGSDLKQYDNGCYFECAQKRNPSELLRSNILNHALILDKTTKSNGNIFIFLRAPASELGSLFVRMRHLISLSY
jgi:hypothetical protein